MFDFLPLSGWRRLFVEKEKLYEDEIGEFRHHKTGCDSLSSFAVNSLPKSVEFTHECFDRFKLIRIDV